MALNPEKLAARLANLIDYLGDDRAGEQGLSYASTGRVLKINWTEEDTFESSVQGSRSRPYRQVIKLGEDDFQETECTCPVMGDCKHVAAAAIRLAGEAYARGYAWAYEVEEYLPRAWRRSGLAKLPGVEGDALGPLAALEHAKTAAEPVAEAVPVPAEAAASAPKGEAGEVPWWRQYLDAPNRAAANEIMQKSYKKHAFGGHTSWYTDTLPPVLAREDNRLTALARYGQEVTQAARYYGRGKRFDDPELAAFLVSDEAQQMRDVEERRLNEQRFFSWLDAPKVPAANVARARAQWLGFENPGGVPLLCYQLLLSTRKLHRSPRQPQAIAQLYDDVRNGRRAMPDAEARMVTWIAQQSQHVFPPDYTAQAREERFPLLVRDGFAWLSRWAHSGLLEWEDGATVQFDPAPAKLVLRPAGGTDLEWRIVLPAAPGAEARELPLRGANILREYSATAYGTHGSRDERMVAVFHREGAVARFVDTAGMPSEVLDAVYFLGAVSAERLRETGAGARLSKKLGLASVGEEAADVCHAVPVRPRVELRLDEDKQITVTVTARAADNAAFNRLPDGDWILAPLAVAPEGPALDVLNAPEDTAEPTPEAGPAAPTAISIVPREQDIAGIDAWIARVFPANADNVVMPDKIVGVTWKLTANLYRDLLLNWGLRPRGTEFLGNKAVLELLASRRVPKFKMKIESTGMDWLTVSVQLEEEMQILSYEEVMAALSRTQEKLVQLSGGRYFDRGELEEYKEKLDVLAQMGLEIGAKEQRVHAMQLAGDAGQKLLLESANAPDFAEVAKRFKALATGFRGVPAVKFDPRIAAVLRPYQQTGAEFLVWACKSLGGALLADDMGLGKTLQTLAAITALRAKTKKDRRPTLVICPASVAHNWRREAERFAPWLKTVVIERGVERKAILERANDYDLIIKNYALARRDIEELRAHEWLVIVVDEAQAIKNPQSEIARTVKGLNAHYHIALTGTPIENRLSDLWSIIDFCVPGYFGTLTHFESASKSRGIALTGKLLRNKLRPLLLRRMKAEVAPELPPRVEERLDCALPAAQRKTYLAELKRTRMLLDQLPGEKADKGPGRIKILAALTRLRQICCDPALVGFPEDGSGKVDVLLELLPPLFESGHKVLIFSQFVKMLDRLKPRMKELGIPMFVLTGATTGRQELVEAFEAGPAPAVFLISLKAGGTGLNLTSASHVVLFDPWWNPAVEAQAIDRTHRIGQDKTVVAFRLVAAGTIEERILDLQARKQDLVKNVLEADAFSRALTRDDLEYLLQAPE